jgi:hypothetical protein
VDVVVEEGATRRFFTRAALENSVWTHTGQTASEGSEVLDLEDRCQLIY